MPRTVMQQAFAEAGRLPDAERLEAAALDAIANAGGSFDRACDLFAEDVRADAGMILALIGERFEGYATQYLRGVAGKRANNVLKPNLPVSASRRGTPANLPLKSVETMPASPTPSQRAAFAAGMVAEGRLMWERLLVNGQPVKFCRREEILDSADRDDIHARFKRALAYGLPPGGRPADYLTDDDAERAWEQARGRNDHD